MTFKEFTIEEARRGVPLGTNSARAWEDAEVYLLKYYPSARVIGVKTGSPRTGKIEFIVDIHGEGRVIITMIYIATPRSKVQGVWKPVSKSLR